MGAGIFFAAMGALVLLGGLRHLVRARRMRARTEGEIVGVRVRKVAEGPEPRWVKVRFTPAGGRELELEAETADWELEAGQRVTVSYDSRRPARFDLGDAPVEGPTTVLGFGAVVLAIGAYMIVCALLSVAVAFEVGLLLIVAAAVLVWLALKAQRLSARELAKATLVQTRIQSFGRDEDDVDFAVVSYTDEDGRFVTSRLDRVGPGGHDVGDALPRRLTPHGELVSPAGSGVWAILLTVGVIAGTVGAGLIIAVLAA
jgi:hypothetical protein